MAVCEFRRRCCQHSAKRVFGSLEIGPRKNAMVVYSLYDVLLETYERFFLLPIDKRHPDRENTDEAICNIFWTGRFAMGSPTHTLSHTGGFNGFSVHQDVFIDVGNS